MNHANTCTQTDKNYEANSYFSPFMQMCLKTITVNATLSLCLFKKLEHSKMKCASHTTVQCTRQH
jgi:hypothetical protein